jgi:heme-degrading monooxygenase HmoA
MNYHVLPRKEEVFEGAFSSVLAGMKKMDGHVDTHLYRDVNDAQSYLIISEWTSRDAFDAFIKSDRFRTVTNWGKEQVLAGPPKHEIYER